MNNTIPNAPHVLEPCPFCGDTPELPSGDGTQYEIECSGCGQAMAGVQICDLMTLEERTADTFTDYRYGEEFVERAKVEAIERWNTRAPSPAGVDGLEPSAGQGGLADLMPKPVCIEISDLHCEILKAKGHYVERADFLKWNITGKYDRIVMNPPFSEGRWQAHLEHAAGMLADNGRLIAILPASSKGKDLIDGFSLEWSQVFSNEFAGTSASVVIVTATHA